MNMIDVSCLTIRNPYLSAVVVTQGSDSVRLFASLHHERLAIVVAWVVSTGHSIHHLLGDSPHGQSAVPGARDEELIVQPGLVKDPVAVGVLAHADGVEGGQPVHGHVVAVPGPGGEQTPARVDLNAVDPALLLSWRRRRQTVLTALEAGDEVEMLGVHVQHHQPVTLRPKDHLLVAKPLATENLKNNFLCHGYVCPSSGSDLVHVGLGDGALLHHGVAEHVPGRVLRGQPHVLEAPVAAHLSVADAVNKVAGYTVSGIIKVGI